MFLFFKNIFIFIFISSIVAKWPQGKKGHCHVSHRKSGGWCLSINPPLAGGRKYQLTRKKEKKKIAVILPAPKMRSNMDTKQVAQRSSLEALQRVKKVKKEATILPAPKMRSNMDTKQVAQRSSLEALQRRSPVRIHAHKSQY